MKLEHYQFLKDLISLVKGFGLYPKGNGKPLSYWEVEEKSTLICDFRILAAMWKN